MTISPKLEDKLPYDRYLSKTYASLFGRISSLVIEIYFVIDQGGEPIKKTSPKVRSFVRFF